MLDKWKAGASRKTRARGMVEKKESCAPWDGLEEREAAVESPYDGLVGWWCQSRQNGERREERSPDAILESQWRSDVALARRHMNSWLVFPRKFVAFPRVLGRHLSSSCLGSTCGTLACFCCSFSF